MSINANRVTGVYLHKNDWGDTANFMAGFAQPLP